MEANEKFRAFADPNDDACGTTFWDKLSQGISSNRDSKQIALHAALMRFMALVRGTTPLGDWVQSVVNTATVCRNAGAKGFGVKDAEAARDAIDDMMMAKFLDGLDASAATHIFENKLGVDKTIAYLNFLVERDESASQVAEATALAARAGKGGGKAARGGGNGGGNGGGAASSRDNKGGDDFVDPNNNNSKVCKLYNQSLYGVGRCTGCNDKHIQIGLCIGFNSPGGCKRGAGSCRFAHSQYSDVVTALAANSRISPPPHWDRLCEAIKKPPGRTKAAAAPANAPAPAPSGATAHVASADDDRFTRLESMVTNLAAQLAHANQALAEGSGNNDDTSTRPPPNQTYAGAAGTDLESPISSPPLKKTRVRVATPAMAAAFTAVCASAFKASRTVRDFYWIFDTGCTRHMSHVRHDFSNLDFHRQCNIQGINAESSVLATATGDCPLSMLCHDGCLAHTTLSDTLYVPKLHSRLFSSRQAQDRTVVQSIFSLSIGPSLPIRSV
jgi:hypothetical protein